MYIQGCPYTFIVRRRFSAKINDESITLQSASRDPQRSPMQWSSDMNAGFNNKTNITWLPVHPDYRSVNVEVQNSSGTAPFWRNIWLELAHVYLIKVNHTSSCNYFSSRPRRKMKTLLWLSTVS